MGPRCAVLVRAYCQSAGVTLPIIASARIPLDVLYDEADPEDQASGSDHTRSARPLPIGRALASMT
jgi:hypothetical protein